MPAAACVTSVAAGVLVVLQTLLFQPPTPEPAKADTPAVRPGLDKLQLPPEAILVICEDLKQAMHLMQPNAIVLSPDQYQEMRTALARLEKQLQSAKKEPLLASCKMVGQVIRDASGGGLRDVLDLRVELQFQTTQPHQVVFLGFRSAKLTQATLDGETPVWGPLSDGLTVQVKEPKVHQLALQLQIPVQRTAAESRIVLDQAPPSAITTMEINFPERIANAVVRNHGPLTVEYPEPQKSRIRSDALGILDQLDLRWQTAAGSGAARPGLPQVAVQGDFRITLEDTTIESDGRIKITARQGSHAAFRFRLPPEVSLVRVEEEATGEAVDATHDAAGDILTIRPRQALTAEAPPWQIRIRTQQPYPEKPGGTSMLGLFDLLDIPSKQQSGVLAVWVSGERRVRFQPHSALRSDVREVPSADGRSATAAFRYWQQPARVDAVFESTPAVMPWVEARENHTVQVTPTGLTWSAEFEITPRTRAALQELEISWPRELALDRMSVAGPVELLPPRIADEPLVRLRLVSRQTGRFSFKLTGMASLAGKNSLLLRPPALQQALIDRDGRPEGVAIIHGRGEIHLACEGMEVRLLPDTRGCLTDAGEPPELETRLTGATKLRTDPPSEAGPVIALGWQPRVHEVRVDTSVFVTPRRLQVVQRFDYRFAGTPPAQLWLRLPQSMERAADLTLAYRNTDGKQITTTIPFLEQPRRTEGEFVERTFSLPADVGDACSLTLRQLGPLAGADNGEIEIPMASAAREVRVQAPGVVQVWSTPDLLVAPSTDSPEWAPGEAGTLSTAAAPGLVLRSERAGASLTLKVSANAATLLPDVHVEKALIEVGRLPNDRLRYRVRLRLFPLRTDEVRLMLPVDHTAVVLEKTIVTSSRGPRETSIQEETGSPGMTGLKIQLDPENLRDGALLDLEYQVQPPAHAMSSWVATLPALRFSERTVVDWVRWQVRVPGRQLAVYHSAAHTPERDWTWSWWLRPPAATAADECHQWIEPFAPSDADVAGADGYQQVGEMTPLQIVYVPRVLWTLVCSLLVLLVGITWYSFPPPFPWLLAGLGLCVAVVLAVWQPAVAMALLYGIQEGLAVLLVVLAVLWLQNRRWRRQVVLMPGFTRLKAGSSLVRSSQLRHPAEVQPSTVDAPRSAQPPTAESAPRGES